MSGDFNSFKHICIVGAGQVGTSIIRRIVRDAPHMIVSVIEPNAEHRSDIMDMIGGGDNVHFYEDIPEDHQESPDFVVVATPTRHFENVGSKLKSFISVDTIVTDVGSVKDSPVEALKTGLGGIGRVVGSHPSFGVEGQGPSSSNPDMYDGKGIFTIEGQDKPAFETVQSFWTFMGGTPISLSAEAHDSFFATTSHFHHLNVFSFVCLANEICDRGRVKGMEIYEKARTWLRNMARIADANEDMWMSIFHENKTHIANAGEGYLCKLEKIEDALENASTPKRLLAILSEAHDFRTRLIEKDSKKDVREGIVGELAEWAYDHNVEDARSRKMPLADNFNLQAGVDLVQGTFMPVVIAAATTLNAKDVDQRVGNMISESPNPSFLDGSAPMLSDPEYLANLLYYNRGAVVNALRTYRRVLEASLDAVQHQDSEYLTELIAGSARIKGDMPSPRLDTDSVRHEYLERNIDGC